MYNPDEEMLSNQQAVVPGGMAPPEEPALPEGEDPEMAAEAEMTGQRQPSQEQTAEISKVAEQALGYLLSDETMKSLAAQAKQDPARAIAMAVGETLQGVYQAANMAGRKLSPDVMTTAARLVAQKVIQVLAELGAIDRQSASGLVGAVMDAMRRG